MPPTNQQPHVTPTAESLDPAAVNLARAIRDAESGGNFQARGKSGEYGAYQFMPSTWASSSRKYLGRDVPLDKATPLEQNEVAYKQIKEWKDQGHNVGQIASMWNAGGSKPNAYLEGNAGVNQQGVEYDTKAYAEKVARRYQELKQAAGYGTVTTPSAQAAFATENQYQLPEQKSFGGKVADFGKDLFKGLTEPVVTMLARPVQLAKGLAGATPAEQAIDLPFYGRIEAPMTGKDVIKDVGRGIQTAALGVNPATYGGAAKIGAAFGYGAGLEESGDFTSGSTLAQGALGGVLGPATLAGTRVLGTGLQKIGQGIQTTTNPAKAGQFLSERYHSLFQGIINQTPTQIQKNMAAGKDTAAFLADRALRRGTRLDMSPNGRLVADEEIKMLAQEVEPLKQAMRSWLEEANAAVNLNAVREVARNKVRGMGLAAFEENLGIKTVDEIVDAEIKKLGLSKRQPIVPVQIADDIKDSLWRTTFDKNRSKVQNFVPFRVGQAAKEAIEKAIPNPKPITIEGKTYTKIGDLNKDLGNYYDALSYLRKANMSKQVRGTWGTRQVSKVVGAIAGSNMGIMGALGGDYMGGVVNDVLMNPRNRAGLMGSLIKKTQGQQGILRAGADLTGRAIEKTGAFIKGAPEAIGRGQGKVGDLLSRGVQKIGESAKNSGQAVKNFPRTSKKLLSKEDEIVQEMAINKYLQNKDQMLQDYLRQFGNVVNTDLARRMFADVGYNGTNSQAVHTAAKQVAADAFNYLLKTNPQKKVYITAGGSGAGKSTTLEHLGIGTDDAALVYDTNLSKGESATKLISKIRAAGKEPEVLYIYRDPAEAWGGVLERMQTNKEEMGRVVNLGVFTENTVGALRVAKQLAKEGNVPLSAFLNTSAGKHRLDVKGLAKLKLPRNFEADAAARVQRMADAGEITPEQRKSLLKGTVFNAPLRSVVNDINQGGITFNLRSKKSLGGTENYAVSPFPNRSLVRDTKKKGPLTLKTLSRYLQQNKDLLENKNFSLGGWFDKDSGNIYLDVSITTPDKAKAIKIGRALNQKAAFDLSKFEEIPTGGTGDAIAGMDDKKILALLAEM